jgi:hypothetical protein
LEDVYRQLNAQMRRINDLPALIDVLVAKAARAGAA